MFDWLFGDGGKARKENEQQLESLNTQRADADLLSQVFNNRMSSGNYTSDNMGTIASAGDAYGQFVKDADTQKSELEKSLKQSRYDYFGNGLLGALLNPIGQTATAGFDLATGQYDANDRDMWSDLGALGETALTAVPFAGGAMKALKLGKAGSALTRGVNSVPGMAAVGAGFGGLEALRQGGSETQLQDALSQAGMGAAFGGGIPLAGRMLKGRGTKVLSNQMASRGMDQQAIGQTMGAIPNRALYSSALRSFVPKSTFGKVAAGAGAVAGGGMLMNGMGGQQPAMDGQMTEEQLYNYLVSQGMM